MTALSPFLQDLAALRARAWGQSADPANLKRWIDAWDADAHHHVIYRKGQMAAAFRFTIHATIDDLPDRSIYGDLIYDLPAPIAWFSRLVVDPDFRGAGLSSGLDWLAANEPFRHGARSILATGGSVAANRFRHEVMLRHGWAFLGEALGTIDLPIVPAGPPRIYARFLTEAT